MTSIPSTSSSSFPITDCFVCNDFEIIDFEQNDLDRYSLTWSLDDPDFDKSQYDFVPDDDFPDFESWIKDNLSFEELWEVPMMNSIWYYPSFVSFDNLDRFKCSGATTLLFDHELDRWGVGMTGGGMDLGPHLLDTFISLGEGVPLQLALEVDRNYSAYVSRDTHLENCNHLGLALYRYSKRLESHAQKLFGKRIDLSG